MHFVVDDFAQVGCTHFRLAMHFERVQTLLNTCDSPLQAWSNIRADIAEQLRLPLCLALLKNCTSPYDEAYSLVSLLTY